MAFSSLPAQHIITDVRQDVLYDVNLRELIDYVCRQSTEHPQFVPHSWTVYNVTSPFQS